MNEWISVKEELPEKDVCVLVFTDPYICVAEYWYDENDKHIFADPPHPFYENITHWMPLPAPPITLPEAVNRSTT